MSKPNTVIPFFQTEVTIFGAANSLADMLSVIREKEFSQFPIYEGNTFRGLITEHGITNWMAKHVDEDIIQFSDTRLYDILPHIGEVGNYQFIGRNESIYIAEEKFKESIKQGTRLDAILITHSGKSNEKLLGIITTWDIINIPKNATRLERKLIT
ncbi:hypothetical protein QUF84_13285 [Fictibacillus enclensis]|uniref:hypothetical protein n=1 Tax=Fictibacillus enclensis TaxID=1017270 RepID=UPI0025A1CAF8|nr:hypothetical protein [Fictibacillus enclensis]MDM5338194.1 hypothetical protein [Fictibacillus enclensis]